MTFPIGQPTFLLQAKRLTIHIEYDFSSWNIAFQDTN